MELNDWLEAIRRESERFALVAERADPDAPVPSCPDWTVRGLVDHLGEVQRFWAANVRAADPSGWTEPERGEPGQDLGGFARAATADLLDALRSAAGPCWTWWGEPATAAAVARHQAQEASIHRWDIESAVLDLTPLDPAVASDAVAEFLAVSVDAPHPVELVCADTGDRHATGPEPVATVTGAAGDLLLALYGRPTFDALTVDGDDAAWTALLEAANTE